MEVEEGGGSGGGVGGDAGGKLEGQSGEEHVAVGEGDGAEKGEEGRGELDVEE